ncbi:MAG: hypothetical protein HKN47_02245 [Pirellulaceae bacterium]|nr:hypothetical protein [Pirellulaceae bacterium]
MNPTTGLTSHKRCLLFVVDALAESIVRQWVEDGKLPNISTLMMRGGELQTCLSIFPSITPAATCSIATGLYPKDHGIEGACWHDPATNSTAYFGDDYQLAKQEGIRNYLVDFADRLNYQRLKSPLIYEHLFESGIESACVNYMWFRGPHVHSRTTPLALRLTAGKLVSDIRGPKILKLGDFVHSLPDGTGDPPGMLTGLFSRYGFRDETTAACTLAMAKTGTLPAFTLSYFPLNDDHGHTDGLHEAARICVEKFDEFLGEFVDAVGGWEVVDRDYTIVIVGDHSQVEWADSDPKVVLLDKLLSDFQLADTVAGFQEGDELLICPNMRAASIYMNEFNEATREQVVKQLLEDRNVDQVIYCDEHPNNVKMYTVRTRDRGRLTFTHGRNDSPDLKPVGHDRYGNQWCVFGELSAVDLRFDANNCLADGDYPNALERIAGAFHGSHTPIWVTAKPCAELAIKEASTHAGGSHGSLHRDDSVAALITSSDIDVGTLPAPGHARIIDVMDLCLASLGADRSAECHPMMMAQ